MKNFRFDLLRNIFLAASLLVFFANCNDEGEEIGGSADLVGTWALQSTEVDLKVGGVPVVQFLQTLGLTPQQAEDLAQEIEDDFAEDDLSIVFNDDNTYAVSSGGVPVEEGTWSLNESTLSINPTGDSPTNFEVLTLNSSTLKVRLTEVDDVEIDSAGNTAEITAVIDYTFTKRSLHSTMLVKK